MGDGSLSVSLGTSGVVFASAEKYTEMPTDTGIHSFCHANGKYHVMGCMLSAAGSVDFWLNRILQTSNFAADLAAIKMSQTDGLYFLPYLSGERSPINDPEAKGVFYGLTMAHTRADMTRAVVEGVCLGLKDCLLAMSDKNTDIKFTSVIGGGARSDEWLQILADCLGLEVRTVNTTEGGGLGAVILAMTAASAYPDIQTACNALISYEKSFKPNPVRIKNYDNKYKEFKQLYLKNKYCP
jgi:xylulokinase